MKYNLLAATASIAFIATGAVAFAQESPKHDQRPATERTESNGPATAPKAEGQQPARAAQAEPAMKEQPKGAQNGMKEQPKGAQNEMKVQPKGAQNERREEPKAAQGANERNQENTRKTEATPNRAGEQRKTAEPNGAQGPAERTGQNNEQRNAPRSAERQGGAPRVMGKVHMSNENAQRMTEVLRRGGHTENVNIAINVGERIPENVSVYPLPEEVISFAPEYRGYDYFMANDEIVFVAPQTHEIVGTIEYEGRAAADEGAPRMAGARPCPVEQ